LIGMGTEIINLDEIKLQKNIFLTQIQLYNIDLGRNHLAFLEEQNKLRSTKLNDSIQQLGKIYKKYEIDYKTIDKLTNTNHPIVLRIYNEFQLQPQLIEDYKKMKQEVKDFLDNLLDD